MTKLIKNRVLKHLNYLKSFGYEYHEPFNFSSNNINNIKLPNSINELNSRLVIVIYASFQSVVKMYCLDMEILMLKSFLLVMSQVIVKMK